MKTGISIKDSKLLNNHFLELISKNLNKKNVKISGFGVFSEHISPKRIGRNPKTKESYIIKSMRKPVFRASKKVKDILN